MNTSSESKQNIEEEGDGSPLKKDDEFIFDEIAWKKVKSDVFRKPKYAMIFSILVGTGV
jgi:hypothetical protein